MTESPRVNEPYKITPLLGNDQSPTDAEIQALLDLGELAYLANTYEDLLKKGGPQSLIDKTLAEFQKLYSYYHINGDAITFDYNEGTQPGVPITDPQVIQMLKQLPQMSNPPTGADVGNYLKNVWNADQPGSGQSETLVQQIITFLVDSKYCVQNNIQNTITNTALLLFYCSLINNPIAQKAGTLNDLLKEGYYNGGMLNLGNIYAIASSLRDHLANDTTLLSADVIQAGLSISTDDPNYQLLGTTFQALLLQPAGDEEMAWKWEARFFPYYFNGNSQQRTINALPDAENTQFENRLAIEKKMMGNHDIHTLVLPKREQS